MTQAIQEGLDSLFERLVPLTKDFSKKSYEPTFRAEYERVRPLMSQIAQYCETAEDKRAAVEEVAGVLPDKLHSLMEELPSRRKREDQRIKYNMGMVAYVIPLFRYGRMEVMEEVVDRMVELWNADDSSMKIEKATFEQINGGFKARLCYITTAVCQGLGRPDDCRELNLLREYRDGFLAESEGGEALIREYYDMAPTIVKRIRRRQDAVEVFRGIWDTYLSPCVSMIEADRPEECRQLYTDMVRKLQAEYLTGTTYEEEYEL